ncbi:MAG: 4-hydroxythreonine-4-phosphate dehydrogenase PdxA [Lentisphaerae bacterium]|nr:4-hydroxythreonine-4-phosphate dehydrogenase PdxA [Lentisphaerota bacterium]
MGDPAGVGPELCLRILTDSNVFAECIPLVFGDVSILRNVSQICALPFDWPVLSLDDLNTAGMDSPAVVDCRSLTNAKIKPGMVQEACGHASFAYIQAAVAAVISGCASAIATAPINKESLRTANIPYPGHTEMLAALTGADSVCMMMVSPQIRVSLVTIHLPCRNVASLLNPDRILRVILLTADAMHRLGYAKPRILVCGLNPHAGEHGLFGNEETDIILPAIEMARAKGIVVEGPVPPDTAFVEHKRRNVDAYVAMYHDQGLIPFKMLAFEDGVNVTLGLPIVRTSVDHGTAFDIAWQGKASAGSLRQSILLAAKLSQSS